MRTDDLRVPLPAWLAVLIAAIVAVPGCGGSRSADEPLKTITVAALPAIDDAPLFIARRHRLFEAEGLRVNIKTVPQSTLAIPALKKGELQVVFGNYVTFFAAQARRALDLRLISEGSLTRPGLMQVVALPRSMIRTPRDLQGRKVAINILNNFQDLTLNAVLRAGGLDPGEVTYVQIPLPKVAAALERGQVDAAYLGEPFLADAEAKLRVRRAVDPVSGPVADWPVSGYFADRRWADSHPAEVRAFHRAMTKAQTLGADRAEVAAVTDDPGYVKIQREIASIITLPVYPASVSAARLQRVADQMLAGKLLGQRLDVASMIAQGVGPTP